MLGHQPYYHKAIKSAIVAFGSIFDDLTILRESSDGNTTKSIDIPIRYISQDKGDARRRDDVELQPTFWQTVPRMGFWLPDAPAYAPEMNLNQLHSTSSGTSGKLYTPAPFRLPIELNVITKHEEDMFQIVEQILPFFRPSYTVSVHTASGDPLDIPFTLQSTAIDLDSEGSMDEPKRQIIGTLNFEAIIHMYGPVYTASPIEVVDIDLGFDSLVDDNFVLDETITQDENA